jgi:dihydroorotate dehydrogenase
MYKLLYALVLRRLPAEAAHRAGFGLIRAAAAVPGAGWLLRRWLVPADPVLRVRVFGRDLPGPFGLAAGFDKDAEGPDALGLLGFAFVEVGTVTAQPQPGNPRPRLFRLTADRALINRMGFNNHGAAAAASRLRRRRDRRLMVGANIGKTKAVPEADAAADYAHSARLLAGAADYLAVNVSSPNTPGLRRLQATSQLRPLLQAVRGALDEGAPRQGPSGAAPRRLPSEAAPRRVPLLVKIAPDLADEEIDAITDLALELGLDGIIATNTTTTRPGLASDPSAVEAAGPGGLSGAPLKGRALEVLRRLHTRAGDRLVLVAAGGIETADDAWDRIRAGATLVQGYTGFIYGGPLWPHRVQAGLARRARAEGFTSIQDAVGTSSVVSGAGG